MLLLALHQHSLMLVLLPPRVALIPTVRVLKWRLRVSCSQPHSCEALFPGPSLLPLGQATGLDWMPEPSRVREGQGALCDLCFLCSRFMPSFLRLGSWNVVMFVTYEQLKRALMAACTSQGPSF